MTEHLWAPLSNKLSAVTIPACLPEETVPPFSQRISEKVMREKEALVSYAALERCGDYREGSTFDGFPVSIFAELSNMEDKPWNDYQEVHEILRSPTVKKLKQNPELLKELKFISDHCDRSIGEFALMKCQRRACEHCNLNPSQASLFMPDSFCVAHNGNLAGLLIKLRNASEKAV